LGKGLFWIIGALVIASGLVYLATSINQYEEAPCPTTTTTITETITITVFTSATQTQADKLVEIEKSAGRCGVLEKPSLAIIKKEKISDEGYIVWLSYKEGTSVPCFRHVIEGDIITLLIHPPIFKINLGLERTSDICVECVGVVETIIRVGSQNRPIPEGTKIEVNGISVAV